MNPDSTGKNENTTIRGRLLAASSTTARLRLAFLVPLIVAVAALFGSGLIALHMHEYDMIKTDVSRAQMLVEKMYREDIGHNRQSLDVAMEVVSHDAVLRSALARRDRAALLRLSAPLFDNLQRKFGITHFYFSGPDRVNILRVHQPARYGDVIDRYTTLEAQRTGGTFSGVELGSLGTFTLRLVTPWYSEDARHSLIGYVEMGMEIKRVLDTVQNFTDVPVFVLVSKKNLNRDEWEGGMHMLGRTPEWSRFPDAVLSTEGTQAMPVALVDKLVEGLPVVASVQEIYQGNASYRAVFLPLVDASGHDMGRMVALVDVSESFSASHRMLYLGESIGAVISSLLLVFFYWLVGRVGQRIEHDENEMQRLATHDGLTELYNRREFDVLLTDELVRAQRFNRSVSLLMIDIDHFKRVNDTYGHQAGDAVLKGLSELLGCQARAIDHVCRYGGEEITVILPEIDVEAGAKIAERLRAAVEVQPFDVDNGSSLHITVSIGVASFPAQADNAQKLVAAADAAMYCAKQGGRNQISCYETLPEQAIVQE